MKDNDSKDLFVTYGTSDLVLSGTKQKLLKWLYRGKINLNGIDFMFDYNWYQCMIKASILDNVPSLDFMAKNWYTLMLLYCIDKKCNLFL